MRRSVASAARADAAHSANPARTRSLGTELTFTEREDLPGIGDGSLRVTRSEEISRLALRKAVGVAGRDVEQVEPASRLDQRLRHRKLIGQSLEQSTDHVAPALQIARQVDGLDRLFGGLLSGVACPAEIAGSHRVPRVLQVVAPLLEPVPGPIHPRSVSGRGGRNGARSVTIPAWRRRVSRCSRPVRRASSRTSRGPWSWPTSVGIYR